MDSDGVVVSAQSFEGFYKVAVGFDSSTPEVASAAFALEFVEPEVGGDVAAGSNNAVHDFGGGGSVDPVGFEAHDLLEVFDGFGFPGFGQAGEPVSELFQVLGLLSWCVRHGVSPGC